MTFEDLRKIAAARVIYRELNEYTSVGAVASALLTDKGNLYLGINIDAPCGMGFCAEHAAIAQMVTKGETRIEKIVAVVDGGRVIPPCGRCREFIYQIDHCNIDTEVMIDENEIVKLKVLLPHLWS